MPTRLTKRARLGSGAAQIRRSGRHGLQGRDAGGARQRVELSFVVPGPTRNSRDVLNIPSNLTRAEAAQRPGPGLIHHSDRGVQYASAEYRNVLQSAGFRASMSRKADCYDNAPMESFFHTLKTELVHHQHYVTRQEARRDIFAYIEGFYNRTRRHSSIGYISPIEMELKSA